MGYDFHITRRKLWSDEEGASISPEEWLEVIQGDTEFTLDPQNGGYFAMWSGPGEYPCWLDYDKYSDGLYTKNPTPEFIEKMVQIATRLDGKVQGDEGEIYPGGGQPPYEEE